MGPDTDTSRPTPAPTAEGRCPTCRASVRPDAPWCTQCWTDLRPPAPAAPSGPDPDRLDSVPTLEFPVQVGRHGATPSTADPSTADPSTPGGSTQSSRGWPCSACGQINAVELSACAGCGLGFLAVLRASAEPLLTLPGVGDLGRLGRGQRLALAGGVVLVFVLLTLLVGFAFG